MAIPDRTLIASSLLESAGQHNPPVNLQQVISHCDGLTVIRDDIDNAGYFIDLGVHGGEILVRAIDPAVRQRFTIAHELGHFVLRKRLGEEVARFEQANHALVEHWCDEFASALLMPEPWIHEAMGSTALEQLIDQLPNRAELFHVSQLAVRLRIAEVLGVSSCEIEWNGGQPVVRAPCYAAVGRTADVDDAMGEVANNLEWSSKPATYRHLKSGLFSVHRLVTARKPNPRWLVCLSTTRVTPGSAVFQAPRVHPTTRFSIPLSSQSAGG
jgi:hypothetical protein